MPFVSGFPPVARRDARVLIVGSMPGERSLAAGRYYAHPANAFWPIAAAFCGVAADAAYAVRTRALRAHRIALWDVLQRCERDGSLDAAIVRQGAVPNDFGRFFARHPDVATVLCNGATAHAWFRRHGEPALAALQRRATVVRLPSTSPAHASVRPDDKRRRWHAALAAALATP
ncbi:MAG: DNA-deoxyinosine glycosylase [Planctomycetes bacterium]|nr:DNA-deoxyinosine glycosylase [Planctomycetota bacterium]